MLNSDAAGSVAPTLYRWYLDVQPSPPANREGSGASVPLTIDTSELPLLRIAYLGDFSDGELEQFLAQLSVVVRRPGKKCGLIDLRGATNASARQRKRQARWIRDNVEVLERDVSAAVIVTDSAIMRGIVTAIFWIRPLPCPTQIEPTLVRGLAWIRPFLEEARQ
jgi:hypothetical protein